MITRRSRFDLCALVCLGLLGACGDDDSVPAGGGDEGGAPVVGAGGTGGEEAGGSPSDGGAEPLHPGSGEPCNVMAQDCADPAAAKCTLDFTDPVEIPSTCQPALGDDGDAEPCERPTETPGQDTCAPGFYCSKLSVPFGTEPERACRALCDRQDLCAEAERCVRHNSSSEPLQPDTRLIGNCAPACMSVFDDEGLCAAKTKCLTAVGIDGGAAPTCFPTPGKLEGAACAVNDECAPGVGCDAGTCRTFCDEDHACPANRGCSTAGVSLGVCRPAPAAWTCPEAEFADGGSCDCGCGAPDPDCDNAALPITGCAGAEACNNGACTPEAWSCNGNYYAAADGCDCGCGVVDPDCTDATVGACQFCQDAGGRGVGACPGTIDPLDNSQCE